MGFWKVDLLLARRDSKLGEVNLLDSSRVSVIPLCCKVSKLKSYSKKLYSYLLPVVLVQTSISVFFAILSMPDDIQSFHL